MEEKFTPGPWEIAARTNFYEPSIALEREKLRSFGLPAGFEAISIGAKQGGQMALIPLDESSKANAHLIAAAPEMYEACEESRRILAQSLNRCISEDRLLARLSEILVRAKGETK